MKTGPFLGLIAWITVVVVIALITRASHRGQIMRQEESELVLAEAELEDAELEDAEEQGFALVHWSFDTKEQAEGVYDALRLAAWRATTAGKYAKAIEPTQPENSEEWVTGITCEVTR